MASTLTPLFSVLFKTAVYGYLRVIPVHRIARFVLPALYALFLGSSLLSLAPQPAVVVVPEKVEVIDIVDSKTHEIVEEIVTVEGSAVITTNGVARPSAPESTQANIFETVGAVLFGFPSRSKILNIAGIALNTVLLLLSADFAYTPLVKLYDPVFTRVGAVDHSSAKVVVRYPGLEHDQIRVVWQRVHSSVLHTDVWKEGPVLDIEEEKDWTASGKIAGLWPSAEYIYRLAYLNSTLLPYPANPVTFKTFPDPRSSAGTHFKFLVSSCMIPNFPYNPLSAERMKGLDYVAQHISSLKPKPTKPAPSTVTVPADPVEEAESLISQATSAVASVTATSQSPIQSLQSLLTTSETREIAPEFMMLIGDSIYADVPHYGGDNQEWYRKLYRRTFSSPSFRRVYEQLPILGIYDDHEFVNNFAGEGDEFKAPFINASSAFNTYYGDANPDAAVSDVNYYDFRYGDNAFFVMDTRRYRSVVNGTQSETGLPPTMLGERQLHAFYSWLGKVNTTTTFKFVVSSVPVTSLWHGYDGQVDSWAAYKSERDAILDVLTYVPNVVILSGDRHEFAFVEHRGKIPEISVSPLSMFAVNSMTLHAKSEATIEKTYLDTIVTAEGTKLQVTAIEHIPEERAIHYIAAGNYKFVSLEVDTRDWRNPRLVLDAIVGGKSKYKFEFVGQPVSLSFTSALSVNIGGALKGVLNKLGLGRSLF